MPAASLAPLANAQRSHVAVYRGDGAGLRSLRSAVTSLERLLPPPFQVRTIGTEELLEGRWQRRCAMLVMPGGADLPYCKDLNGRGNELIREYVCRGGSYLGLCAGAYYACERVEFEVGSRLQVVGDRELAFFPGVAHGAAFPGFDYQTERGAVAAAINFRVPAALCAPCTSGRAAPSEHSTIAGPCSWHTALDYCNGGPFFLTAHGPNSTNGTNSSSSNSSGVEALPGVQVLAWYDSAQHPAAAAVGEQGAAAAVRCEVGAGVAVLCGTHPELGPEWLDPCGRSTASDTSSSRSSNGSSSTNTSNQANGASAGDALNTHAATVQLDQIHEQPSTAASLAASVSDACQQQHQEAKLVQHTATMRAALLEYQSARELFLECLIFEALHRTGPQSSQAAAFSGNACVLA